MTLAQTHAESVLSRIGRIQPPAEADGPGGKQGHADRLASVGAGGPIVGLVPPHFGGEVPQVEPDAAMVRRWW